MAETLWTWLGSQPDNADYLLRGHVEGAEILHDARKEGRGVILVGQHLMALDCVSPWLAEVTDTDVIYRYNKNPVIEALMVRGRGRFFPGVIEREDTRAIVHSLKQGHVLWYAADQDYGRKHSVFADFFGVPAATITATARLARLNGSPIVIMSQYRNRAAHTWTIRFERGPANYPSGDANTDARAVNECLERAIARAPEQYLWMHRRFKTRPPGAAKLY